MASDYKTEVARAKELLRLYQAEEFARKEGERLRLRIRDRNYEREFPHVAVGRIRGRIA